MRKQHKLKRRVYQNPGPNAVWHADGYDKLKPYDFAIHGCIDGWSRKVLWLLWKKSLDRFFAITFFSNASNQAQRMRLTARI
jgi:hypothetical protein